VTATEAAARARTDANSAQIVSLYEANVILARSHYLGTVSRGIALLFRDGVMVLANPTSRRLPHREWFELTRWCITGGRNAGSRQWAEAHRMIARAFPRITTVVSYSDPSAGHSGALYKASGWLWAPTWHRLVPPPSGNGVWSEGPQSVKDRWAFVLRPDANRAALLGIEESYERRFPGAGYRDPLFRRDSVVRGTGGGDFKRWQPTRGGAE